MTKDTSEFLGHLSAGHTILASEPEWRARRADLTPDEIARLTTIHESLCRLINDIRGRYV